MWSGNALFAISGSTPLLRYGECLFYKKCKKIQNTACLLLFSLYIIRLYALNHERGIIMGFIDVIKERAKSSIKTIVLPETEDMRTIEATDKILKEGVAKIILIGNEEEINKKAAEGGFDISGQMFPGPVPRPLGALRPFSTAGRTPYVLSYMLGGGYIRKSPRRSRRIKWCF